MLKAVIVDDDPGDREVLEFLLKKYCADDVELIGSADSVSKASLLILEKKPDLVFLDVELGDETGFDLLTRFTDFNFSVIFVTAYDRYAMQAIKFNALDYVLKPVEITELVHAVKKLKEKGQPSLEAELKNLIHTLSHPHQKSNRIAIPLLTGYRMITVNDIMYCEASKEYTYIHTVNESPICSSINLGEYEDLLQEYSFCRVHHSYLVNKEHVKQYIKGEGGELVIDNGARVPVSRRKKQEVNEWLVTL
jgi:two-component system LytT family response regulator